MALIRNHQRFILHLLRTCTHTHTNTEKPQRDKDPLSHRVLCTSKSSLYKLFYSHRALPTSAPFDGCTPHRLQAVPQFHNSKPNPSIIPYVYPAEPNFHFQPMDRHKIDDFPSMCGLCGHLRPFWTFWCVYVYQSGKLLDKIPSMLCKYDLKLTARP